jgi:ketosteroid isomerase-like protein
MNASERRELVERYVRAYNGFDVDGMTALLHPECTFHNVSRGTVTASTVGAAQFRELAERSKALFSSRRQSIATYCDDGESVTVDIDYEAVLKVDIADGPKAGEAIRLKGRTVFGFRDGLIYALTDEG